MIVLVSKAKLYFSRNLNPRLAVAAARFLKSPVEFEFVSPFSPEQREKFLKLNPNLSVPILVEGDKTLWEADSIACRLSQLANSDFWPMGESLPDVVRWISWGYWNFVRASDRVHFGRVTKQRQGIGPMRQDLVESGLNEFASSAAILEQNYGDTTVFNQLRASGAQSARAGGVRPRSRSASAARSLGLYAAADEAKAVKTGVSPSFESGKDGRVTVIQRVATRRQCLILLKNRSTKFRAR
ncbi:MAG: glutathione S-transferase family protein [Hyphomicrobiales bacterium]|nr:glutathione S-transferase family protein [Hyphomicrobiales bacterium]